MTLQDASQDTEDQAARTATASCQPKRRGLVKTAWTVVAILVLTSILMNRSAKDSDEPQTSLDPLQKNVMLIQGQYVVAASQVPGMDGEQLYESAKSLNTGPAHMRLRFVVLAGELMGPDEAADQAASILGALEEEALPISDRDRQLIEILQSMYSDYQQGQWKAPSLTWRKRQMLRDELGWFGALALAPKQEQTSPEAAGASEAPPRVNEARAVILKPAWLTFAIVIAGLLIVAGVGISGLGGAIAFGVLTATKRIRSALGPGAGASGIYAETFAVWMTLFFVLTIVAGFAAHHYPAGQAWISCAASLLSLLALGWPVLRGVPWRQVRGEVGLHRVDKPLREVFWGVVCYVSNLPLLAVGLFATVVLLGLYNAATGTPGGMESANAPAHPVVEWASGADWTSRLQIFILACVIAPIVEETVFRGVLYRHLRDHTGRWSAAASILFSAAFSSFIFAVIHPQGVLATPALMGVAGGLALAREWRGSLLASMTMHAMNNGVMMILLFTLV